MLSAYIEMPIPGVGATIIPRGPNPVAGDGRGIEHSKPWGTGDFLKIPLGFWEIVYWYDVWQ